MQVDRVPVKIGIMGKSGSGKTTYQTRFVSAGSYDRYFIFDHKTEISRRLGLELSFSLDEIVERLKQGERHLCYNHSEEFPGGTQEAFQIYAQFVYDFCHELELLGDGQAGDNMFVCDEVNLHTSTSDLGPSFQTLVEDGRLNGIDLCMAAQGSNGVNTKLRGQLSEVVALKTTDARPLAFLEESGFDVEEVRRLERGQFIVHNLDRDIFVRGRLFAGQNQSSGSNVAEETEEIEADLPDEETPEGSKQTPPQEENDHGPVPLPSSPH